ncbi:MAG: MoxR family ATPase [Eubacteriales bacterium]|nr:MoxR family ATPase [Eubacteriales bacterium]MDD4743004.1 MoxR family ATPase [Eubacteriales bacterium]
MELAHAQELLERIRRNVGEVIVGKRDAIDLILIALISKGHILLEDIPGIGKTTLVSALARSLGLTFRRIQFTPDVMPSDVTGFNLYNQKTAEFAFHPGAIMSQLLLADEINRTSPKTQSSLLEAMQENQVTVDGVTYPLPRPFMVLATQNPIEQVGTYPLPEAQLDRFMLRVSLGYPSLEEEMAIYLRFSARSPLADLSSVVSVDELFALQDTAQRLFCAEAIRRYVALLARATREHKDLLLGTSPRGALMLLIAARARALLQNRDYVLPEDVQQMLLPVLGHRLLLKPEAKLHQVSIPDILAGLLRQVPVPEA